MRIALDAMGTDRYPAVEVEGAVQALREIPGDFELILVGDRERIEAELCAAGEVPRERLRVLHAGQRIEPGEAPASSVRRKTDSSIVTGLTLVKDGGADAFVSAGSTGAVMAASLFLLRPLPGVDRPAVATVLPTAADPVVMLDAGANVDSKPVHLLQFAHLGAIYARDILRRPVPRVGLLNIGEESEKGNELAVEAHHLLEKSPLHFIGNVEGRDIIRGVCDVLVTDGFVGNVLLKFYESVAGFFLELLKREVAASGAHLDLGEVRRVLDYTEYGGAPLLGVNGISIICHGGSPPRAVKNAIGVAIRAIETHLVGHARNELLGAAQEAVVESSSARLAEGA
ncbi:MAG TPA: phosphate acyltransferase PlsX [Longimicrobiales bacterium]